MDNKRKEQNEPQENSGYEVKDKRRFNPDGTPRDNAEEVREASEPETAGPGPERSSGTAPGSESSTQEASGGPTEAPPPNIYAVLQFVIGLLAEQAWVLMGLRLAPGKKEMQKDLGQARIAIDSIVFLADKLYPHISEEERTAIRSLVSDLQINFVRQS